MTRDRTIMAVAFGATALGVSSVSLLAPVLPELALRYGVGVDLMAYFQTAVMLPGIITGILAARLARTRGRRVALTACLVLFGAAGLSGAAATSFPLALVLRVLQGVGGGGLVALSFQIARSVSPRWRVRAIGYNAAVVSTMMVVLPLIGSTLGSVSTAAPFAFYGLALPAALVVWRVLPAARPSSPTASLTASAASPTRGGPPREVLGILVMTVLLNLLVFGWLLLLTPLMLDANGIDLTWRGWALALQSALATLATFVTGRWRVRGRFRALTVAGWAAGAVFLMGAGLLPGALAVSALVGAGIFYGLLNPVLAARIGAVADGEWFGWWQSCARTGQVLGPVVAAWLMAGLAIPIVLVLGGVLSAAAVAVVGGRSSSLPKRDQAGM